MSQVSLIPIQKGIRSNLLKEYYMRVNTHHLIWVVLVFSVLSGVLPTSSQANSALETNNCRAADSLVLVDFHRFSFGDNWTIPWDLTQPMDTWYGVALNANGCVECIDMDGQEGCGISVSFGNGLTLSLIHI